MRLNNLRSPLVVLAPYRVKVSHVKHLVVLAHVWNSMTTSVLRSSEGSGSRPFGTGVSAARRRAYGGESPNPCTSSKQGEPDEGGARERRRPEKTDLNLGTQRISYEFLRIFLHPKSAPLLIYL